VVIKSVMGLTAFSSSIFLVADVLLVATFPDATRPPLSRFSAAGEDICYDNFHLL